MTFVSEILEFSRLLDRGYECPVVGRQRNIQGTGISIVEQILIYEVATDCGLCLIKSLTRPCYYSQEFDSDNKPDHTRQDVLEVPLVLDRHRDFPISFCSSLRFPGRQ